MTYKQELVDRYNVVKKAFSKKHKADRGITITGNTMIASDLGIHIKTTLPIDFGQGCFTLPHQAFQLISMIDSEEIWFEAKEDENKFYVYSDSGKFTFNFLMQELRDVFSVELDDPVAEIESSELAKAVRKVSFASGKPGVQTEIFSGIKLEFREQLLLCATDTYRLALFYPETEKHFVHKNEDIVIPTPLLSGASQILSGKIKLYLKDSMVYFVTEETTVAINTLNAKGYPEGLVEKVLPADFEPTLRVELSREELKDSFNRLSSLLSSNLTVKVVTSGDKVKLSGGFVGEEGFVEDVVRAKCSIEREFYFNLKFFLGIIRVMDSTSNIIIMEQGESSEHPIIIKTIDEKNKWVCIMMSVRPSSE